MTAKTTNITARVHPDTRTAFDRIAAAGHTTTSELAGRVLSEWMAAQATPIEHQAWYRAGQLAVTARGLSRAAAFHEYMDATAEAGIMALSEAVDALADAIDALAGTAPE